MGPIILFQFQSPCNILPINFHTTPPTNDTAVVARLTKSLGNSLNWVLITPPLVDVIQMVNYYLRRILTPIDSHSQRII